MKTGNLFPSKFLKKEDFPVPTVLSIKRVSMEEVAKGEEKPILFFNEKAKGIVLNKTKLSTLEDAYGDETDDWAGRKVRLSIDPSVRDLAGNIVGGIKLECSKTVAAAPKPVTVTPPVDDGISDEIPF